MTTYQHVMFLGSIIGFTIGLLLLLPIMFQDAIKEHIRKRRNETPNQGDEWEWPDFDEKDFKPDPLAESYEALGCDPSDSMEEIKRRYHELARSCHPDTLAASGKVTKAKLKKANAKFAVISKAYESIVEARMADSGNA